MPIEGITQPQLMNVDEHISLKAYDGHPETGYDWYQDDELVLNVEGSKKTIDLEYLNRMYTYQDTHGELYFILYDGHAMGDVCLYPNDMAIVISKEFQHNGIGKKVISRLIERGRALGYSILYVDEIYDFNEASRKLFTSLGFIPYKKTDIGHKYLLFLGEHATLGEKTENDYYHRLGAYILPIENYKIACVKTPKGYFLLGGGKEDNESDVETIKREVLEEIGYDVEVGKYIGGGDEYYKSLTNGYIHPVQLYYSATLGTKIQEPTETDHKLVYLSKEEALAGLYVPIQRWIVEQTFKVK